MSDIFDNRISMTSVREIVRAKDAEIERLRADNARLRDVLTWVNDNCTHECKGVTYRVLEGMK